MIILDIINLKKIKINETYDIQFINNGFSIKTINNEIFSGFNTIENNTIIEKTVLIIENIGDGSYGTVYKISIDDKIYALKITDNEIPENLKRRFNSLNEINNYLVQIYCSGNINDKYYSIMEYGGISLRKYQINLNNENIKNILYQLYKIITICCEKKLIIPDFKLDNITINNNVIKLIDIYILCEHYKPCKNCHLTRTYLTSDFEFEKNLYNNEMYNFTAIYIPLAVSLIDLLCEKSFSFYCKEIFKQYQVKIKTKEAVLLLQIANYNFNSENKNNQNNAIKKYNGIYKHKKKIEKEYPFIKNIDFYKKFIEILKPKYSFITKKIFSLIINGLINLNPDQRNIKYLTKIL
jgi:serine/threonine protein kinase